MDNEFDYWRLCDELSVFQAILLTLGYNPSNHDFQNWEGSESYTGTTKGYYALKTAIIAGIERGMIDGNITHSVYNQNTGTYFNQGEKYVNLDLSTIDVISYKNFLEIKGFKSSHFFFPDNTDNRDYLDKNHPHYSPKLAMTIKAWEAIRDNPKLLNRKTPKQALEKQLREMAPLYGFTDENGLPQTQPIEDMAKVGNWNQKGGVAKAYTPPENSNPSPNQPSENNEEFDDSSIPF